MLTHSELGQSQKYSICKCLDISYSAPECKLSAQVVKKLSYNQLINTLKSGKRTIAQKQQQNDKFTTVKR